MARIPSRNIRSSRNQRAGLYFNISELLCQRLYMKESVAVLIGPLIRDQYSPNMAVHYALGGKYASAARFEGKQIRNWATVWSRTFAIITCMMENSWQFTWKHQFLFFLIGGATTAVKSADQSLSNHPAIGHPKTISTIALQLVNFTGT